MGVLIDASILIEYERGRLDAASCLARGLRLATANAGEFERVPGLEVEIWGGE